MTPDPAAVAALRFMGCPWSLGLPGEAPVCASAASESHACSSGPDPAESGAQPDAHSLAAHANGAIA